MWLHLNKRFLQYFLVLVFLASGSLCLYSAESPLAEEEIRALTEEQKVQAILILDQALTSLKNINEEERSGIVQERAQLATERAALEQEKSDFENEKALLIFQESLSETLIRQNKENYAKGFREGGTLGSIIFSIIAGAIVYNTTN